MDQRSSCPCGLGNDYLQCCGRYIETGAPAPDPESLMRSRYSAYALRKRNYLLKTWHPKTCTGLQTDDLKATEWQNLTVIRSKTGFKKGYVEFLARYGDRNGEGEMHEISRFQKINNRWYYLDSLAAWPEGI